MSYYPSIVRPNATPKALAIRRARQPRKQSAASYKARYWRGMPHTLPCVDCEGRGGWMSAECQSCAGRGVVSDGTLPRIMIELGYSITQSPTALGLLTSDTGCIVVTEHSLLCMIDLMKRQGELS